MNAHIVYIPFTGVGLHGGFRGDEWYRHRIQIFKEYTLKSLKNQSTKDFIIWCSFRPEERDNPLTREIAEALKDADLNYIFTFDGLMYWDDKFTDWGPKTRARNLIQMVADGFHQGFKPLSEMWRYTWENKNDTLPFRLERSLYVMAKSIGTEYDWIYLTRIDSDDMFHKDALDLIQQQEPAERRAFTFQNGYMYNVMTGQLAEWIPPTNPPFHTIVFTRETFFDPVKHLEYYRDFHSHEDIPRVFDAVCLDDNHYAVTAHGKDHISTAWEVPVPKQMYQRVKYYSHTTSGKNISTRWQSRTTHKKNIMLGKEFRGESEKRLILKDFGIDL